MKILLVLSLIPSIALANNGFNILIKDSTGKISSPIIKQQKQIILDDNFLVQFYGSWRSIRNSSKEVNSWAQLVLDKKNESALKSSFDLSPSLQKEESNLVTATQMYLMYKLGLNQSFINLWLQESATNNFLNTPFGIALDQVVGLNASRWILDSQIYLDANQKVLLTKIKNTDSLLNFSVQGMFNLRKGEKSLEFIGKLPIDDPIRLKLANSVILDYARRGELAKSAKVLKEIYEPVLENEKDIEKISNYYLILARMLYQARAYQASEHYYSLIPDESRHFLTARTEKMWLLLREGNLADIKGEVETLHQNIFTDIFMPETYLVSAIAHLKLCQFKEVEKVFKAFVANNKKFILEIDKNIESANAQLINKDDFFVNYLAKGIESKNIEINKLDQLKISKDKFKTELVKIQKLMKTQKYTEIKRQWLNRKKLMLSSMRKMRFVKIEFLSTMRRLQNTLAKRPQLDDVSLKSAGIEKSNKLVFKYDGVLFGDELFHYQSDIQNLCLKGVK